jgi:hypothetical protein
VTLLREGKGVQQQCKHLDHIPCDTGLRDGSYTRGTW